MFGINLTLGCVVSSLVIHEGGRLHHDAQSVHWFSDEMQRNPTDCKHADPVSCILQGPLRCFKTQSQRDRHQDENHEDAEASTQGTLPEINAPNRDEKQANAQATTEAEPAMLSKTRGRAIARYRGQYTPD